MPRPKYWPHTRLAIARAKYGLSAFVIQSISCSFRENVGGGTISFGRAFAVGILITIISSICYVIAWQILYHTFMPDFFEKYSAYIIENARAAGATPQALQAQSKELEEQIRLYKNPFLHVAFVFLEPFPVGLLITLISTAVLRKKARPAL